MFMDGQSIPEAYEPVQETIPSESAMKEWNLFIAGRPKTTTLEKIKMRQAFMHAWEKAMEAK